MTIEYFSPLDLKITDICCDAMFDYLNKTDNINAVDRLKKCRWCGEAVQHIKHYKKLEFNLQYMETKEQ